MKCTLLQQTISKYSTATEIVDSTLVLVEVTDGLRVLGTPISSLSFCESFVSTILKRLVKMQTSYYEASKMYKQWLIDS
jgi:hypothetical protein